MQLDLQTLERFNRAVPRYTSYPTAPEWGPLNNSMYVERIEQLGASRRPLSLYVHVPFCRSMCLYCACSVVLNRKPEREQKYVDSLIQEAALFAPFLSHNPVLQLHFGGGTPTQLAEDEFSRLIHALNSYFIIDWTGEMSIEIDPRTVMASGSSKLQLLRSLGFNRVSFGVQDTQTIVQEAVRRRQTWDMTKETYFRARELGFTAINIDLIYGLPYQTRSSFAQTAHDILSLRPNRIAMYSYAKVPWLKPHQKAIRDDSLPSTEEKLGIYIDARQRFLDAGYIQIGMDHFALPTDSLAQALAKKMLQRNFQGYSVQPTSDTEDLIGLGMTATGLVHQCYAQNCKTLEGYYAALDTGTFPVFRGKQLSRDDQIRKWTIHKLMCDFTLDLQEFEERFSIPFSIYFAQSQKALDGAIQEGLLMQESSQLVPTPLGKLFIRNVVAIFDAYLPQHHREGTFSKGV